MPGTKLLEVARLCTPTVSIHPSRESQYRKRTQARAQLHDDAAADAPPAKRHGGEERGSAVESEEDVLALVALEDFEARSACARADASLPEGTEDTARPPEPEPTAYDASYAPPAHRTKRTELMHPLAKDDDITFFEGPHLYLLLAGRPAHQSTTAVAASHYPEFNEAVIIAGMQRGGRQPWPRHAYAVGEESFEADGRRSNGDALGEGRGVLLWSAEGRGSRTWAVVPPEHADATWTPAEASARLQALAPQCRHHTAALSVSSYERPFTSTEISAEWERNRNEAAARGTEAHYQMELYLNRDGARLTDPEVRVGMRFLAEHLVPLGARAWRTELEIFKLEEDLAGSIDAIFSLPASNGGGHLIVDWKRSPKLRGGTRAMGSKRMRAPLDHLHACDVAKYALQLSIYAYVLRSEGYGLDIRGLALASLHPEAPYATAVPDLRLEVEFLMAELRLDRAQRDAAAAEAPLELVCALSGLLLLDPVRVEGVGLCDRKAALCAAHRRALPPEAASAELGGLSPGGGFSFARDDGAAERSAAVLAEVISTAGGVGAGGADLDPGGWVARRTRELGEARERLLAERLAWEELMPRDGMPLRPAPPRS